MLKRMTESGPTDRVVRAVGELKELLVGASTEEVADRCVVDNYHAANGREPEYRLSSPAKQQSFLLSLLLSTAEPERAPGLDQDSWKRIYELLDEAFIAYLELFWPTPDQLQDLSPEWRDVRSVALPAFLHYFNAALLASVEQVKERINRYVVPFDDTLERLLGISATDAVRVADWIHDRALGTADDLVTSASQIEAYRDRAEALARERGLPLEAAPRLAVEELGLQPVVERLRSATASIAIVTETDVPDRFGDVGHAYLKAFVAERGGLPQIAFPTEASSWDEKALIRTRPNRLLFPSVNGLYTSILVSGERALEASERRPAYLRGRDEALEGQMVDAFRRLLPGAVVHRNVFERSDNQFEHDLILCLPNAVLIAEAKAAPPVEPFRDPDRAFTRLKHAFRSDRGIQHAFEQASRIRRRLDANEPVALYDRRGRQVELLDPERLRHRVCVCVTRDDFGPLATDLALLLEKPESEPYPWAVNILALEDIVEAWKHLGWGQDELLFYLEWRLRAHGKVFGTDELEYVGYHIRHGSLKSAVESRAEMFQLSLSYSDWFDELYNHLHFDGPAPSRKVVPPVVTDLRRSLTAGELVVVPSNGEVGRNQPCPCGSGKKFKRCCGRP